MRITIVTDAWHPQVNGVVTTLSHTIRTLQKWGHEVLPVTPELFKSFPCPTYPEIRLSWRPQKKIACLLDEFAPHAIHIATEGPLGWAARSYCLRNNFGFTTSYHTRFPEYVRLRAPIPLWLSYMLVRKFHAPAVRTMVATEDLKNELTDKGFKHLRLWSRGVDTNLFRPRSKSFLKDEHPIAMFVGRVAVEKNLEDFLQLEFPAAKYVIGDGPALAAFREKYPEVRFPGFKMGEELASHIAAADVFVFPSRTDTFGLVMIEAMACGVPVAAYPVTGPLQIVRNGESGIMAENLQRAVFEALKIEGSKCRAYAKQYSWEACSKQFVDNLYKNHRSPREVSLLAQTEKTRC